MWKWRNYLRKKTVQPLFVSISAIQMKLSLQSLIWTMTIAILLKIYIKDVVKADDKAVKIVR